MCKNWIFKSSWKNKIWWLRFVLHGHAKRWNTKAKCHAFVSSWKFDNLIMHVVISMPWTMELFSRGGVCHLVPYKIQGNMVVLILKSTTLWKIEKFSNYMSSVFIFLSSKFCHFVTHILQSHMKICSEVQMACMKNNSHAFQWLFQRLFNVDCYMYSLRLCDILNGTTFVAIGSLMWSFTRFPKSFSKIKNWKYEFFFSWK